MGKLKPTQKTKITTPTPKKAVVGNAGTDVKKAAPADTIKPHKTSASPSNANSARDAANSAAESARNVVDKPTGMPSGKHSSVTPQPSPAPNSPSVQSVGTPSHTESRMTSEPTVPSGVSSTPQQSPSLIRNMMSRLPIPQTPWNIGGMKLSGVDIRNRDVPSSIANVPSKDDENGNAQDGSEEQPNASSPNEENGMPENQDFHQDEENRDSSDDNNGDNNDDDDNSLDRTKAAASRSNHGLRGNAKSKDIAKDAKDKVGEAVKNLGDTMPGAGSLISQMPQQSLTGSLAKPGGLNNNSGNRTNGDPNNKDNKKKNKTPLDKLKGKAKKALIKALISHLAPILIGVMSLSAIGSCSAAMFMGNDNTEIEQTRGQNKKIVINGGSNSNASNSSSSSSSSSFNGDWIYYNQSEPNWDLTGTNQSKYDWIHSSCGICSYAMVLSSYAKDKKYTPTWCELNNLTYGIGIYQGPMCNYVNNNQNIFHLKATYVDGRGPDDWQNNWDKVKKTCDNGGCVIIGQTAQSCSGGNHYIVVRKVDGDNVTIADPVGGVERQISAKKLLTAEIGDQMTKNIYFEKVN